MINIKPKIIAQAIKDFCNQSGIFGTNIAIKKNETIKIIISINLSTTIVANTPLLDISNFLPATIALTNSPNLNGKILFIKKPNTK